MIQGGALEGLRVIEFGEYIVPAYTTRLLADYGAEVIKVERPPAGDVSRRHGPFPGDVPHPERSGLFLYLNVNKLGITLDPETATGRDLLRGLIAQADILVENNPPAQLERWGLDYASLRRPNPGLVMTSCTVFGHQGPWRDYKGYAITAAAASGVAFRVGDPARNPLTMPYDRADYWGGIHAAAATVTACMARERTGLGQHVDISTADAINTIINPLDYITYVDTGAYPKRAGHRTIIQYPFTLLPCKDGYVAMMVAQDRHWQRFLELLGNPAWSKNPRYMDRFKVGTEYPQEMDDLLHPWLMEHTKREFWDLCRERKIPFQPVFTIDEVMAWEQLRFRGFWRPLEHPEAGTWTYPGPPFKMVKTPGSLRHAAPRLGEHNQLVYGGMLGVTSLEMTRLRQSGIV